MAPGLSYYFSRLLFFFQILSTYRMTRLMKARCKVVIGDAGNLHTAPRTTLFIGLACSSVGAITFYA